MPQLSAVAADDGADMARPSRFWRPGSVQHLISRFVDRQFLIIDAYDRAEYLRFYGEAQDRWDWRHLSHTLMSSHLHHGLVAGIAPLESVFRSTHTRMGHHLRDRYGTLGHVFADRPKSYEIHREMRLRMVAYHHRNPVDAGVVDAPAKSLWTSHRWYLRLDPAPGWFDVEWALSVLGFKDTAAGRRRFDEFVRTVDLDSYRERLCAPQEHDDVPADLIRTVREAELPPKHWQRLIDGAAAIVGLRPVELLTSRGLSASRGRRLVGTIAREYGQSYTDIARRLGRGVSTIHELLGRAVRDPECFAAQCAELRERASQPDTFEYEEYEKRP